jgi:CspA family cold shock protein
MPTGIVKWFDFRRGFGFILHHDGRDVFVHYKVIEGEGYRRLWNHDEVEYDILEGPRGLLATRVRRLTVAIPPEPFSHPIRRENKSPH